MQWAIAEWDYVATHDDELETAMDCRESFQRTVAGYWKSMFEEIHADAHPIAPSDYSYEVVHEADDITAPAHAWEEPDASSPSSIGLGPFQDNFDARPSPPPEPSDTSDADEVVLPPNWSATTNNKGRLYYYNVVTKETSWKLPSAISAPTDPSELNTHVNHPDLSTDEGHQVLPRGWDSAHDEEGSMYFFNSSTGETTWDKPTSPESPDTDHSRFQSPDPSEPQSGLFDVITPLVEPISLKSGVILPTMVSRATPKRQSSADENMLQSQLLSLSLSEEELNALTLSQLPTEHIQRKGSLRVKSQKVSSNATISSWKDYWVVVYKGFLLFYRDDNGTIKGAYSLKSSSDSMTKIRNATQVKPSGCFDAGKVAVDLATKDQALTKKKNVFYLTPGTNVRLLLQDSTGNDEKTWVRDIQTSLASRRADESSGSEEPYLIQILRRQTSGGGEASGLKMNKKIEEKDLKSTNKNHNPLKLDKARGIRSMVAQGIHVPRRKSAQDERLRLPDEDTLVDDSHDAPLQGTKPSGRPISTSKRTGSRDHSKDHRKDSEQDSVSSMVSGPNDASGSSLQLSGAAHNTKVKLSNMSRSFFSKDKDKDKDKEKDREKDADQNKDRSKDKSKDKYKDKEKDKDTKKGPVKSIQVFGGSLVVEPGRTIPNVVELCVKTIEARGLSTAGIYRVSGHMSSIQNLKRAFNEGSDVEKLIEKEPDINTIAALLKLYFRELREPLMLFDFYPSFIAAADIEDYNEKLYTIKSLVHSLPEPNFSTLQYLMMHLGHIQDQYQTTKMDSANLAICFAPNLLRQEVDDLTSIINTGKQSSIVDTLIEQREWLFDPYPEDDEEEEEGGQAQGEKEDEPTHHDQDVFVQYETKETVGDVNVFERTLDTEEGYFAREQPPPHATTHPVAPDSHTYPTLPERVMSLPNQPS
ncbi:Rho GTPase-activating protein 21 [Podila clonocystis]|nr:Rho GTPase-activating protein 21 [Podila clonocystis]